jgi:membrane-associated phospholipid phosphatase
VKAIFLNNRGFLLPYLLFIILGAVLVGMNTKTALHIGFNSFHNHFFDIFFRYITWLGDGITWILAVLMLFTIKYRYAFIVGLSCFISSMITQLLKRTVFSEMVRPRRFFEGVHEIYFVPGVENYTNNSFPSGHTTVAFSLCLGLALISKKNNLKWIYFILALLIAYSRVYLSQHFFGDIYAGSIIAVITTLAVFYFLQKSTRSWLDGSTNTIFKK